MVLLLDESEAFIKKAKSKLTSSKALYEIEQYGDSVGRSYYAMFLSAKALLIKDGYNVNSHKSLIGIFGREYVKNLTVILPNIFQVHNL